MPFLMYVNVCRIAEDYEKHARHALKDPEKYLANALNAYLLVKKFTTDWKTVHSLLTRNTGEGEGVFFRNHHRRQKLGVT